MTDHSAVSLASRQHPKMSIETSNSKCQPELASAKQCWSWRRLLRFPPLAAIFSHPNSRNASWGRGRTGCQELHQAVTFGKQSHSHADRNLPKLVFLAFVSCQGQRWGKQESTPFGITPALLLG